LISISFNELQQGREDAMFDCVIQTDGFGVCFVFARKKKGTSTGSNELMFTLEDFNLAEINNFFPALFSQPRKKSRIHSDSWP
jgi:hypothetical protein